MAIYEITGPKGEVYEIEGPDDADPSAVIAQLQPPQSKPETYDPSTGGGTLQFGPWDTGIEIPQSATRFLAGTGKAMSDLGRGVGQLMGMVSEEDVAESRRLDAPLMATRAGKVGNVTGAVATTVPAMFIPGANTVAGAGAIGAGYGLLQPTTSTSERVANTAIGGAVGAAAQGIGGKVATWAQSKLAARAQKAATEQAQNTVRDATLAEARKLGYVVPPSTTNPTAANRAIESVAGKAATQQSAALKNQSVTNRLVREELGLAENAPISKQTLNGIRAKEGQVYKALKSSGRIAVDDQYIDDLSGITASIDDVAKDFPELNVGSSTEINKLVDSLLKDSFDSSSAVELVKQLRKDAASNLSFQAAADPSKRALGMAQREAAGIVEDQLIRHLEASGKGALAKRFDQARIRIAKTYSVESALNEGSGNVVASQLATQLKRGKPLSGNFEKIAKFAQAFPKAAAEVRDSAGVSALDAIVGTAGATTLNPALAVLPFARIGTREALLTKTGQKLAQRAYEPGKSGTAALKALASGKKTALPLANASQKD